MEQDCNFVHINNDIMQRLKFKVINIALLSLHREI